MTHTELCDRACRWLAGSRQCNPVFSRIASCSEVPDAIGWSSRFQWSGSIVVECKTSAGDFHSDRRKYTAFKDPQYDFTYSGRRSRITKREATERGYEVFQIPRMGNFRFYMCEPGILSVELVAKHAPDHGLVYVPDKRRVIIVRPAPRRVDLVDRDGEIRYLRFAIINQKNCYQSASPVQDETKKTP